VLISTTRLPGLINDAAPCSPKSACEACCGVATITINTSHLAAASAGVRALRSGTSFGSYAATWWPASASRRAIGVPMAPSPNHPTR
jgi:hypothetical protein